MKISGLLLFSGSLLACCTRKVFRGIHKRCQKSDGRYGLGLFFDNADLPGSIQSQYYQLIPMTSCDRVNGFFSRENLLRANFYVMSNHLNSIGKAYNNKSHDDALKTMEASVDNLGSQLYRMFKKCLYLVDFIDADNYRKFLEENRFTECFYLVFKNLKTRKHPHEYINILKNVHRTGGYKSNCFYQAKDRSMIETDLSITHSSNMPSADFLNDPLCILELDLYERVQLLKYFYLRCFQSLKLNTINDRFTRLLSIYQQVYIRGYPKDHRITAFVLYKIFSELRFSTIQTCLIENMETFLREYYDGLNLKKVNFFILLTFGRYEK